MKGLIVVDAQNDFVSGSLAVPGAELILPVIQRLVDAGPEILIATRDWHPVDHCSFVAEPEYRDGSWPKHCVQFTRGAAFAWQHPGWLTDIVSKGTDRDREAYSGFDGTGLADKLRGYGVDSVEIVGLALDYCVAATAIDAAEAGFDTAVILDGTRAVTEGTAADACDRMEAAGVELR